MKKIFIILFFFVVTLFPGSKLSAQVKDGDTRNLNQISLNSVGVDVKQINIPFFKNFIDFNSGNASVWSWLTFGGTLLIAVLIIFWIGLMIRSGIQAMQGGGTAESLGKASKEVQSVLLGVAITILIPVILTIVGYLIGIGNIFQWPKMFSKCEYQDTAKNLKYEYYFQVYLSRRYDKDAQSFADTVCQS